MRRLLIIGNIVLIVVFLMWRVLFTFNSDYPYYSLFFFVSECILMAYLIVFYLITYRIIERPQPASSIDPRWSVDVFITTFDEDLELLKLSAVAAKELDFPHNTWICDDGKRELVRQLASSIGVGYITREQNLNFKAGNLNNAYSQTAGDFIVVIDADHILRKDFLERMLPYFHDTQVAFVQSPQNYYNNNSFQRIYFLGKDYDESSVFQKFMQMSADRFNGTTSVGSGVIYRRSCIDKIGGFPDYAVTEDTVTSFKCHQLGYKSVFVPDVLGYCLAPETSFAYEKQRFRWGLGQFQVFIKNFPWRKKHLNFLQYMMYLVYFSLPLGRLFNFVIILAPSVYLIGNISPIRILSIYETIGVMVYIILMKLLYHTLSKPYTHFLFSSCYHLLNWLIELKTVVKFILFKKIDTLITPKGISPGVSHYLTIMTSFLFIFNLSSFANGVAKTIYETEAIHVFIFCTLLIFQQIVITATALICIYMNNHSKGKYYITYVFSSSLYTIKDNVVIPIVVCQINTKGVLITSKVSIPTSCQFLIDMSILGIHSKITVNVIHYFSEKRLYQLEFSDVSTMNSAKLIDVFLNRLFGLKNIGKVAPQLTVVPDHRSTTL